MKSAFEWPDSTRRAYLTGALSVSGAADGEEYELGTGALDQTVRGVRLKLTYGALTGGPDRDPRAPTRVWLDLLRGEQLIFFPLAAQTALGQGIAVAPDLSHQYDWMQLGQGPGQARTLKMTSRELLAPDDPIFDLFADTLSLL
jgi:hypothetical protein